jgi:predicted RNase H-like HicB family nuclease
MSENMGWVCVVYQDGKHLHRALGYTAEEARQKAMIWCEKHAEDYPAAIPGQPRLQFQKSI